MFQISHIVLMRIQVLLFSHIKEAAMKKKVGYVMLIGAVCAIVLAGTALAGKPADYRNSRFPTRHRCRSPTPAATEQRSIARVRFQWNA